MLVPVSANRQTFRSKNGKQSYSKTLANGVFWGEERRNVNIGAAITYQKTVGSNKGPAETIHSELFLQIKVDFREATKNLRLRISVTIYLVATPQTEPMQSSKDIPYPSQTS